MPSGALNNKMKTFTSHFVLIVIEIWDQIEP